MREIHLTFKERVMTKRTYMVCRADAVRGPRRQHQINSSCFPVIVEFDGFASTEDIVNRAFDQINEGYRGKHEYIVIPMCEAQVVSFVPKPTYDVSVRMFVDER